MERQIQCLVKACEQAGYAYELIDREKNFLRVMLGRWEYFQINRTPLNSEVAAMICKDKAHSYALLSNVLRWPKTLAFLDFAIEEKYQHYVHTPLREAALQMMAEELNYPVVLKPNQGGLGLNVQLCHDSAAAADALATIFNQHSKAYDYVAVAQQFIPAAEEYRLVCVHGQAKLAYRRGRAAPFNARYWEHGEQAELIEESALITELQDFVQPIFAEIQLGLVGFDILRDAHGQLYLIELNSSPRFDHLILGSGEDCVIEFYRHVLAMLDNKRKE